MSKQEKSKEYGEFTRKHALELVGVLETASFFKFRNHASLALVGRRDTMDQPF